MSTNMSLLDKLITYRGLMQFYSSFLFMEKAEKKNNGILDRYMAWSTDEWRLNKGLKEKVLSIKDLLEVTDEDLNKEGVCYMLGDFYIGKTTMKLEQRLIGHLSEVIQFLDNPLEKKLNTKKIRIICANLMDSTKIKVSVISSNVKDEKELISKYIKNGGYLSNISMTSDLKEENERNKPKK